MESMNLRMQRKYLHYQQATIKTATAQEWQEAKQDAKIESAVIEIGGKIYEGKNHAEAILKAKSTGKSVKHWFITELGHQKTERLHLHGIVWGIGNGKKITDNWKYGITFTGCFVNEKTIQYITKYITKIDEKHKDFIGKVLCSKGIGAGYIKRDDAKNIHTNREKQQKLTD